MKSLSEDEVIVATAWNNGRRHQSGAGFGLKISLEDRAKYFPRSLKQVRLLLPNGATADVNIDKSSFWNDTCRELISAEIGHWLLEAKLAPWPKRKPPKIELLRRGNDTFEVRV